VPAAWDRGQRAAFAAGLWRRDPALWSDEPAHQQVAARRLGWLGLPAAMRGELAGLAAFAGEVRAEGFTHAVLLGMGGSSLAPEVMRRMLGVCPGCLELTVLDNTSPAAVRAVAAAHDPARTLLVVSSKSGGTIEVASFERYFFEWSRAARGDAAGAAFVAITDPGSPLETLARERGYRRVFLNPPDVGGRYSALSLFGLVPAALIGADLDALLASAARELDESRRDGAGGPGVIFGAALGAAALAGADKLTLAFGPGWAPFGAWVEQLVAESTGKDGRGILPVDGERVGPATLARADRAFAVTPDLERAAGQAIAHSDRPAWLVDLAAPAGLGAAFLRWEIATATAAAVLGVDPFDEPNVAEAKQATAAVLERALAAGSFPEDAPLLEAAGARLWAGPGAADALGRSRPADAAAALRAVLDAAGPVDYFAVLAYLHATPAVHARLERVRAAAVAAAPAGAGGTGMATTLGYGPRFLHSTGQLHKGGPDTGIYLQLTAAEEPDLAIPGERYSFGTLRRAQAAGDYETLARRGRRVLRLDLGADPAAALDALAAALEGGRRG
jgi:transaldolase/glucose-6-phosphate isomerase